MVSSSIWHHLAYGIMTRMVTSSKWYHRSHTVSSSMASALVSSNMVSPSIGTIKHGITIGITNGSTLVSPLASHWYHHWYHTGITTGIALVSSHWYHTGIITLASSGMVSYSLVSSKVVSHLSVVAPCLAGCVYCHSKTAWPACPAAWWSLP